MLCVLLALSFALVACGGDAPDNGDSTTAPTDGQATGKPIEGSTEAPDADATDAPDADATDAPSDGGDTDGDETNAPIGGDTDGDETNAPIGGGDTDGDETNAPIGGDETVGGNVDDDKPASDIAVEDIVLSSVYADGVAVVNLRDEANVAYVIDKDGNIVFQFPLKDGYSAYTVRNMKFQNGLLVYDGICYEKSGRKILPETVGATAFLEIRDGAIVVENIVSDYTSATTTLGVLNTDFEWIVPMSEGAYKLYHSNSIAAHELFWNTVVASKDDAMTAFVWDEKVYRSDGKILDPAKVNVLSFIDVYENKYVLARATEETLGVMNPSGVWVIVPNELLWNAYCDAGIEIVNGKLASRGPNTIVYYDLETKSSLVYDRETLLSGYAADEIAISEINGRYDDEGYHIDITMFGPLDKERISEFEIFASRNDRYVLVRANQPILLSGYEYEEYVSYEEDMDVYAVMNSDFEWVVKGVIGDVEIRGDYLCVGGDFKPGYYDLRTGAYTKNAPADLPEDGEDEGGEDEGIVAPGFDVTTIPNYYTSTEFVDGKAAVAMWNSTSREMYISLIDAEGEFLFTPIKVLVDMYGLNGLMPFYFDGTHIVIADNTGCGTGYITNSLTLYTYSTTGVLLAQWKASDDLDCWNSTFEFNDGVLVFSLFEGQYSDYYRQSRVEYYSYDLTPMF